MIIDYVLLLIIICAKKIDTHIKKVKWIKYNIDGKPKIEISSIYLSLWDIITKQTENGVIIAVNSNIIINNIFQVVLKSESG